MSFRLYSSLKQFQQDACSNPGGSIEHYGSDLTYHWQYRLEVCEVTDGYWGSDSRSGCARRVFAQANRSNPPAAEEIRLLKAAVVSSCQPQEGKNEVGQDSQPELRPTGHIEVIRRLKSSLTAVSGDGLGLLFSAKIAEKAFLIRPAVPCSL